MIINRPTVDSDNLLDFIKSFFEKKNGDLYVVTNHEEPIMRIPYGVSTERIPLKDIKRYSDLYGTQSEDIFYDIVRSLGEDIEARIDIVYSEEKKTLHIKLKDSDAPDAPDNMNKLSVIQRLFRGINTNRHKLEVVDDHLELELVEGSREAYGLETDVSLIAVTMTLVYAICDKPLSPLRSLIPFVDEMILSDALTQNNRRVHVSDEIDGLFEVLNELSLKNNENLTHSSLKIEYISKVTSRFVHDVFSADSRMRRNFLQQMLTIYTGYMFVYLMSTLEERKVSMKNSLIYATNSRFLNEREFIWFNMGLTVPSESMISEYATYLDLISSSHKRHKIVVVDHDHPTIEKSVSVNTLFIEDPFSDEVRLRRNSKRRRYDGIVFYDGVQCIVLHHPMKLHFDRENSDEDSKFGNRKSSRKKSSSFFDYDEDCDELGCITLYVYDSYSKSFISSDTGEYFSLELTGILSTIKTIDHFIQTILNDDVEKSYRKFRQYSIHCFAEGSVYMVYTPSGSVSPFKKGLKMYDASSIAEKPISMSTFKKFKDDAIFEILTK